MGDKELMWALKTGDMDEVKAKLVTVMTRYSSHLCVCNIF